MQKKLNPGKLNQIKMKNKGNQKKWKCMFLLHVLLSGSLSLMVWVNQCWLFVSDLRGVINTSLRSTTAPCPRLVCASWRWRLTTPSTSTETCEYTPPRSDWPGAVTDAPPPLSLSRRYFEGGVSSVYLWDLDHGFAGVILIKKAGDGSKKIKGCWDSIHVVEVQVRHSN